MTLVNKTLDDEQLEALWETGYPDFPLRLFEKYAQLWIDSTSSFDDLKGLWFNCSDGSWLIFVAAYFGVHDVLLEKAIRIFCSYVNPRYLSGDVLRRSYRLSHLLIAEAKLETGYSCLVNYVDMGQFDESGKRQNEFPTLYVEYRLKLSSYADVVREQLPWHYVEEAVRKFCK